jgi:hypothetical protein
MAYVENVNGNDLQVVWPSGGAQPVGHKSKFAPALAALVTQPSTTPPGQLPVPNQKVILVYVENDKPNRLLVTTSFDGEAWTSSVPVTGPQASQMAPALVVSNDQSALYLVYVANNSNNLLLTTSSDGGSTWSPSTPVQVPSASNGLQTLSSQTAPALAVNGSTLVLAYVNDGSNDLMVTTSSNGGSKWTVPVPVGNQTSKMAPAIAVLNPASPSSNSTVVLAYVADNSSKLLVATSLDGGSTWPSNSGTGHSSQAAPALICSAVAIP